MADMSHSFSRREALGGLGAVSLGALLAGCGGDDGKAGTSAQVSTTDGATATVQPKASGDLAALFDDTSACTLTPEQTEGPYYFDVDSIRTDITEDREGVPLRLAVRVRDADCEPLPDAVVDIWHCDAEGVYSGFDSGEGETFLRGAQVTNADGIVQFKTIYPGWYQGRTVHIHAKVHLNKQTVLTTQLYFDDAVTEAVYGSEGRDVFNDDDGIFDERTSAEAHEGGEGTTRRHLLRRRRPRGWRSPSCRPPRSGRPWAGPARGRSARCAR